LPWRPDPGPPVLGLRLLAAVADVALERVLERCRNGRLLGAVRDAQGLRLHLQPAAADGLVLARGFGDAAALIPALPAGWALLLLTGTPGAAAGRLAAAVARRPRSLVLAGRPWPVRLEAALARLGGRGPPSGQHLPPQQRVQPEDQECRGAGQPGHGAAVDQGAHRVSPARALDQRAIAPSEPSVDGQAHAVGPRLAGGARPGPDHAAGVASLRASRPALSLSNLEVGSESSMRRPAGPAPGTVDRAALAEDTPVSGDRRTAGPRLTLCIPRRPLAARASRTARRK